MVFADTELLDRLVAGLAARPDGVSPARAVADVLTEVAAESAAATPAMRLRAIQLVGIVRTTTSPELRDNPDGLVEAPGLVEG